MTVLSVAEEVAKTVGLDVPTVLASSTDREIVELRSVMNWVAERLVEGHDWQALKKLATITGDGSTENWPLETDYQRMTKKARLWTSSLETPLTHIIDEDEWLELDTRAFDYVINAWTMYGDQIYIKPALASGVTVQYFYIDSRLWKDSGGTPRTGGFTADDDAFRLSEKLLRLGTIYRWKQLKKQPYAEEMADYEDEKDRLVTADGGAKKLVIGRPRKTSGVSTAYPYPLGSP